MRSLTLLRHAKTERDSPTGRDLERQLAEQGRRDAVRLGAEIQAAGRAAARRAGSFES